MGLLLWLAAVVMILWTLAGVVLAAPIFIFLYGIYFLGILIASKIKSLAAWRIAHGKHL